MGLSFLNARRPCNRRAPFSLAAAFAAFGYLLAPVANGQDAYDPSWYDDAAVNIKIAVLEDGVYRVTGADLASAGVDLPSLNVQTMRLFENGTEIPIDLSTAASFGASDFFQFVGKRNTGESEIWAYNNIPTAQTSTWNSLYSDTTFYWLQIGGVSSGLRYTRTTADASGGAPLAGTRARAHNEVDNIYYPGQGSSAGNPIYTDAEGFYAQGIRHNTSQNVLTRAFTLPVPDAIRAGTESMAVSALVTSETVSSHLVYLRVALDSGGSVDMTVVDSASWSGIATRTLSASVPQDQIPAGSTLSIEVVSTNQFGSGVPNNLLLDWVDVSFVRELKPIDGQLSIQGSAGDIRYDVTGLQGNVVVYAAETADAITLTPSGGNASFRFNSPDAAPSFYLTEDGTFRSPVSVRRDQNSSIASLQNAADYVIIAAPALLQSAGAMAAYRQTAAGGAHSVMVINVQDVFDEFDYGRPTPIAIRRFVRRATQWSEPIRFLALWGDGLYPAPSRPRFEWEVPSFGHTVSDAWYAMQNAGPLDFSESIAIGRIPIRSDERGNTFVDKMNTYESQPISTWQKRALFLAGGFTESERTRLQQSALQWSARVASDPMGMDTLHFFKTSTSVLDPTFQDSLQAALEIGASWEVYFGHSATQTWEIVTDPPSQYNNAERLPIVLSLGCFTGDFATGSGLSTDLLSFSEQLVIESVNGSIAHWGASSSGTIGASARISDDVHQAVFGDTLRVLGEALRLAKQQYNADYSDPISVKHLLQYGLIGDPATQISLPDKPDFRVDPADIRITPLAPVPADRELTVDLAFHNVGLTVADTVVVNVKHALPDGSVINLSRSVPPFGSRTTEQFRLDIDQAAVGLNRIEITADADDRFAEISELNNTSEQPVTVFATGLSVISPIDFALFNTTDVTLRVTSSTATDNPPSTLFQLDSVPTFDSPSLVESSVSNTGLVAEWKPQGLTNGVWYWRVRVDDPEQADVWTTESFTIDVPRGETGWMQSDRQFEGDFTSPTLLAYDDGWELNHFDINVSVASERGSGSELGQFTVGSQIYERLGLGFGVLVLDGRDGSVRRSSSSPLYANDFVDPGFAYDDLIATLNMAAEGDYVFVRTRHLGNKNNETVIPDSVKALFSTIGSTAIETLTYQDLWIFKTRLGFPDETIEFTNAPTSGVNEIIRKFDPVFQYRDGAVLSPTIGPTTRWKTAAWEETLPNGSSTTKLSVVSASGDSVLVADVSGGGPIDLSGIDASRFPFLRLQAVLSDSLHLATPQLVNWRADFDPVPEIAIDRSTLALSADTVDAGDSVTLTATVANLTELAADSVIVTRVVIDAENVTKPLASDTLTTFTGSQQFTTVIATEDLVGSNTIRIEARQPGIVDQIQVNNVVLVPLVVRGDETPPVFALTVDGQSFPNDPDPVTNLQDPSLPFVSNRPVIEVRIEDENQFAPLIDDTLTVDITFNERHIPRSALSVQEDDETNALVVSFQPDLSGVDSTHTVVVEVQDAAGNKSPDSPYQVHFRTQSAMQLETVYPYPNPMRSFTTFAFNLRGADAANVENMRLRIYTISGRLIREFDMTDDPSVLDGGGLQIGWNKLRWDGRDSDGDAVATGVYLYRVYAQVDGQELKSANASAVEKVVVIR